MWVECRGANGGVGENVIGTEMLWCGCMVGSVIGCGLAEV